MQIKKINELANEFIEKLDDDLAKIEATERRNELLRRYQGEDRVISWGEIKEKVLEGGEVEKMQTGLTTFDEALRGGIEIGRLIVLSAVSKSGKSSFSIDLMRKLERYKPCMIVLEQPAEELIREQLFYKNEIPNNMYSPKTFSKVTTKWIEDRLLESYLKFGSRVAVIDHLDFIDKNMRLNNKHEQIQEVMEELKLISRRLNMTIFLVAHINKLSPDEKPNYNHLAESSSIYKLSDITLMLWREAERNGKNIEYTGLVNLSIELSRQGGTGTDIKLIFDKGKYREAEQMEIILAEDKANEIKNRNKKYEL